MDVYAEYLVKKRRTGLDTLKMIGLIVAAVIVAAVGLTFGTIYLGAFAAMIVVAACYGAYWLISGMNIEYEYIVTNGEMDLDKIIAQRKRKRLATVKISSFEEFGVYHPHAMRDRDFDSRILACIAEDEPNAYYAVLQHETLGECLIVFHPNERVVTAIKAFLPRTVHPTE